MRNIAGRDCETLEHAFGETFHDGQRLVVHVVTLAEPPEGESAAVSDDDSYTPPPEWRDVFGGLSDEEIADIEETTRQRPNLTREPS